MTRGWPAAGVNDADARALRGLIEECVGSGISRRALLLRLSALPQHLARPHHRRLAREAILPLAAADRARLFELPGGDLVMVWRGDAGVALAAALASLSHLFAEAAPSPAILFAPLDLPLQAELLRTAITECLRPPPPRPPPPEPGLVLDGATLATLERALAQADVTHLARRRAVCMATSGGFELRWEQRLLSVEELTAALAPGRELLAEPWLFRRLTRTLDRRMLALLSAPDELRGAGPFSLKLNANSILSPGFLRFDAMLPPVLRGHVVLELHPADMLSDPAGFSFARDFARARQYRLLLRGLTATTLAVLPREANGMDLIELRWSEELMTLDTLPDAAATVLSRVDNPVALAWGRARGATLFRGALVRPPARRISAAG